MKKFLFRLFIGLGFILVSACQLSTGGGFPALSSSDETITASINRTMRTNPYLTDVPIHVETHQRTVLLSGYVKTIRQSDTAGEIASKTPGVQAVQNNLIVRK